MALPATVCKARIELSDLRENHFDSLSLVLAQHPSETSQRLLARLLAYCLYHHPDLQFTRGLCQADDPDIWQKNPDGRIAQWIELGEPDFERVKKARNSADQVSIISYKPSATIWWKKNGDQIEKLDRITVLALDPAHLEVATQVIKRQIELAIIINDSSISLYCGAQEFLIPFCYWHQPDNT